MISDRSNLENIYEILDLNGNEIKLNMNSKYLGVEEDVMLNNEVNMFNIFERIYKNNEKI